jgi:hypothetical protein
MPNPETTRPAHWNGRISDAANAAYDRWLDLGQALHVHDRQREKLMAEHKAAHAEVVRLGQLEGWHA